MLLFALMVIGSSLFTVKFSFQEQFQVLKDVGLGAISIFSWLLGLLCTALLLPKDTEDRTLYTILAKPVPRLSTSWENPRYLFTHRHSCRPHEPSIRREFWTPRTTVLAETAKTTPGELAEALEAIRASVFQWNLIPGILLIYLKAILCATLTLFISTFASSSVFTVLVSVVIYLIGNVQGIAREYWLAGGDSSPLIKVMVALVALVFPDLQLFNVVDEIAVGTAVPMLLFWKITGFGLFYALIYMLLAQVVFSTKEL